MKKILAIVFISAVLFFPKFGLAELSDADLREQIRTKEEEIKKLEAEEVKFREALSGAQSQSKTLKGQILVIEKQIARVKADLKVTQAKISKADSNIRLLSKEITGKQKEVESRQKEIAESMRFLAREENQSFIIRFLKSDKLSGFLSATQYLASLQSGLYTNLQALAQNKIELQGLLGEEKDTRGELEGLKKEITVKNRLVENQKKEKDTLLKETKNQEVAYQKMISEVQIKQAEIQKEIFELEDKLRGQVSGVPKARTGALAWPLVGRLTQGYGPTSITGFINGAYKFHNGIDIAAYYGAPIRASLDGIVAATGDNGKYAYGKWVAIRHDNGLTTLYGHFSAVTVSAGQALKQGAIIGYEGSTGFVTGPHLHFTVYSSNTFRVESRWFGPLPLGGAVNPFDYL